MSEYKNVALGFLRETKDFSALQTTRKTRCCQIYETPPKSEKHSENYKFPFESFLRLQVKRKWSKTTIQYKTYSIYKNIVSLGWNPHRCTYDRNKFNGALGLGLLLTIYICIIRCILPPLYLNGHASQGHNGRGRKCTSM